MKKTIIAAAIIAVGLAVGLPTVAQSHDDTLDAVILDARIQDLERSVAYLRVELQGAEAGRAHLRHRVVGLESDTRVNALIEWRENVVDPALSSAFAWPAECVDRRSIRSDVLAPYRGGDRIAVLVRYGYQLTCGDLPAVFVVTETYHEGEGRGRWCEALPATISDTHRAWWESHPGFCFVPGHLYESYILDDSGEFPIWRHYDQGLHGRPSDGG